METERRILANTAFLSLGQLVGQLANFVFVALIARAYGAEILGQYSLAMSIGASLCIFVSLGMTALLTREISRQPEGSRQLVGTVLPVYVGNALVVWLLIAALAWLVDPRGEVRTIIVIIGAYHILARITALLLVDFQARERMLVPAMITGGERIVVMILGMIAVISQAGAVTALAVLPAAALMAVLMSWRASRSAYGPVQVRIDPCMSLNFVRRAGPFFLILVLATLYGRAGIILLAALESQQAVGLFAAADRIVMAVAVIQLTFVGAVYPAFSRLAAVSEQRFTELATRCLRLMLVATMPLATVVFIFSADIVRFAFGPEFRASGAVLAALSWILVLRGIGSLWSVQALARGWQTQAMWIRAISVLTFISSAVILIQRMSYTGLAYAMLGAELLQSILLFVLLATRGVAPRLLRLSVAPLLACAAALGLAFTLADQSLAVRMPLIAAFLALTLWVSGAIRSHDIRYLVTVLRGGPPAQAPPAG